MKNKKCVLVETLVNKYSSACQETFDFDGLPELLYLYVLEIKKYNNESNKIFNYIFFNLKKGLTSGTKLFKKNDEYRNLGIYLLHVYFIERTKINGCNKYIILRNPHTFRKLKNSENNVYLEVGWSKLLIYN